MARSPKTEKLQISALRRGEIRFDTKYTAPEAAKSATRFARQGWTVEVQSGHRTKRTTVFMKCVPVVKGSKTFAKCSMTPAFKKRIRWKK